MYILYVLPFFAETRLIPLVCVEKKIMFYYLYQLVDFFMKRQALLIQSPLSGVDYRPGVCIDILRWKSFLMSLHGGAWDKTEILVLNNPTKQQLKTSLIRAKYSDFSIVVFSGHGFVKKDEIFGDDETFLYLNESQDRDESVISEYELNPGTPRCILSFDCCRDYEKEPLSESIVDETFGCMNETNRGFYRSMFERQVMRCEKGCTRLYSASVTESANDAPSFTQILLSLAKNWSEENPHKSMNVRDAMYETINIMRNKFHLTQTPEYKGGRRLNHFPLIIG